MHPMPASLALITKSGFSETANRDELAETRQRRLIEAAGNMPVLGPNCYGLINCLDRVALWPDQHGAAAVDSGVAIITQSSNIAINLTMQQRGLPVAYVITVGNQAQATHAELANAIIEILKTGVTPVSRVALLSHTRSLSGNDAAASAFIERLNMIRVHGLGEFIETLKVLDSQRAVGGYRLLSMSCSGGEAAMIGDAAVSVGLNFPRLDNARKSDLKKVLGKQLSFSNPLDYHTAIWDDEDAMFAMVAGGFRKSVASLAGIYSGACHLA